jgi:hypothetical protein
MIVNFNVEVITIHETGMFKFRGNNSLISSNFVDLSKAYSDVIHSRNLLTLALQEERLYSNIIGVSLDFKPVQGQGYSHS